MQLCLRVAIANSDEGSEVSEAVFQKWLGTLSLALWFARSKDSSKSQEMEVVPLRWLGCGRISVSHLVSSPRHK